MTPVQSGCLFVASTATTSLILTQEKRLVDMYRPPYEYKKHRDQN